MEKKYVPGADYEEVKKGSRRKKKTAAKDESIEAGPSSTAPSVPTPLSGTSTGTVQTPASTGARQPIQTSNQPTPASPSSTRPTPSAVQTGTRQAGQASTQSGQATMSTRSTNTPAPGFLSAELSKGESSNYGAGQQEVVRLKGQPSRPVFVARRLKTVALATNYFKLTHEPSQVLWHYEIIIQPEIKGPKLTQVIKTALSTKDFKSLSPYVVTDFSAIMLSMQQIPDQYRMFKISYHSEIETQASDNAKEYKVSLDLKGSIDLKKEAYLDSADISSSGLPVEQALDIILGHHRKLSDNIAIVNKRKAFSLDSGGKKLETAPVLIALRGYFSSVRMSQASLLVNVNVCHGAFYEASIGLINVIRWLETTVDRSKVPGLLRGLRVNSTHVPRVWSIWGYARNGDGRGHMLHPPRFDVRDAISYTPDQVSFFYDAKPKGPSTGLVQTLSEEDQSNAKEGKLKPHNDHCSCSGQWLTITKYFEIVRMAPLSRQARGLPVVNVGSNKRPTYLPSHLCKVRPGQVSKLKLVGKQTTEMISYAVRHPDKNANYITTDGFTTLGFTSDNDKLKRFKIDVNKDMVNLQGRILPSPRLFYADKTSRSGPSWNLEKLELRKPMELNNWACLRIIQDEKLDRSIYGEECFTRLNKFQADLKKKGICVEKDISSQMHGDLKIRSPIDYSELNEWFKSSRDDFDVRFILVVLPQHTSSDLYNHIKRFGDVVNGVHTVCVKANKFGSVPYDDNVALKINLKLKGTNHILEESAYGDVFKQKTMVVGIDVTHPPPGAEGAPSVAAVVASCDKHLSQWPADLRINNSRQEMVKLLRQMFTTRLEHFRKTNQESLPKNILIYRDGVGEGQYKIVLEEELPRLRDACRGVYGKDYVEGVYPRISLIVVGKRHHTRFYRITSQGVPLSKTQGNPQAGTLVDNTITQDCNWDFFLQSHTAISGTARPAHYFVLVDEIFRAMFSDPVHQLELLTNNMCSLYGKATVSVSIPPAVYYADKACDRGRRYLSRVFEQDQQRGADVRDTDVKVHEYLEDTMFYI